MWGLPQKQNARRADKIRLCGHLRRYKKIVKKTYIIYDKYESHERFLKSRHLHIRHYIEEASIQNLPLEECLINHLGKEQGHSVYKEYVS